MAIVRLLLFSLCVLQVEIAAAQFASFSGDWCRTSSAIPLHAHGENSAYTVLPVQMRFRSQGTEDVREPSLLPNPSGPDSMVRRDYFGQSFRGQPGREERNPMLGNSIREPGPDLGDFPNSAYTLNRGSWYAEFAPVTLTSSVGPAPAMYLSPFLIRYGVTDDLEFRVLSNGVTKTYGQDGTTGFSPLALDLKVHLWDDRSEIWLPAVALEVYLLTEWGSKAFQGGVQPSIALNFDLPLDARNNLEWTMSYTGIEEEDLVATGTRYDPNLGVELPVLQQEQVTINQFAIQWAVEHEVNERLELFVHGFYNGAIFLHQGSGAVVGAGCFWTQSSRLIFFGSCNAGLDHNVSDLSGQLGGAIAF